MQPVVLPFAAFTVTVGLHLIALRAFPRWKLVDFPERYGHKRSPIPYPTGSIAVVVFLGLFLPFSGSGMQSKGILASVLFLAIVSFIDDRKRLPSSVRLFTQALIGFFIFATGSRIYTLTNPLDGILGGDLIKLDTLDIQTTVFGPLPFWSGVFTVFWVGLTMNALNWFDGIPGQVSVLSVLGFLTIGFLSLSSRVNQPELAHLAFILSAIAAGGLFFDFPPNRVLMGDTGAMFFGLMLGVLTIYSGGKVATAFLVLGVPLIDLFIVILRRLLKGTSIFRGNEKDEHLHHRLLARGWSARQIIALTASLGLAFGVTALFLSTKGKFIAALLLLIVMMLLSHYSGTQKKS